MKLTAVQRSLIVAFAAVVLSFIGASWFGQHRAAEIERAALSIHSDAAPSIRRLANARAETRRLQLLVHRALDEESPRNRILEIGAGQALLEKEVEDYRRLPPYSGELAVWQQADGALARLNADLAAIVAGLERHDPGAARARQERFDASSEAVARALTQAIEVNVSAASALAAGIQESRRRSIGWAIILDGAGVLLAGVAATISLRMARAHSRAVQAYREVAERRAEELEQFASRMAHDVRTPLSAAGLSVALAARTGGDDVRFRRSIERARVAVAQTSKIIEALFEFARSGARPQPGARACVAEAAENVATVMQARADEVGAEIVIRAESRSLVPCSGGVLCVAIGNLVGNALTYVEGAATRRVTIVICDDGREVTTTVADTGPGLPSGTAAASLFEPYVRGERARGKGLGLGLATVSRIVSAHGGRVGVRSSAGGCEFWFTLPVAGAEPPPGQRGPQRTEASGAAADSTGRSAHTQAGQDGGGRLASASSDFCTAPSRAPTSESA